MPIWYVKLAERWTYCEGFDMIITPKNMIQIKCMIWKKLIQALRNKTMSWVLFENITRRNKACFFRPKHKGKCLWPNLCRLFQENLEYFRIYNIIINRIARTILQNTMPLVFCTVLVSLDCTRDDRLRNCILLPGAFFEITTDIFTNLEGIWRALGT